MMTMKVISIDLHTTGKDPFKDRITGISCKWASGERIFTGTDEGKILDDFVSFYDQENFGVWVGFNINNFDIPFFRLRCLKYNISIGQLQMSFIDLRAILANNRDRVKGKLSDYKKLIDITGEYPKVGINVSWSPDIISKYEDVLLDDVRTTWMLFERSMEIGLI